MADNNPKNILGLDIMKELSKKYVDWNGINNSYFKLLKNATIPSHGQLTLLNALGIVRLGMQLSDIDTRLVKIEHLLLSIR